MFTPGHLALYGLMSSLYFSTKSFMELLSKIASLSCLTGPSSRLASAKVRTFLLPAKSFLKYFCRAKSPDSGTRGLSPLFSSGCGVLPPTAFFSRFSYGADCKLRHFTPTRQIFLRKSFGFMLHNMLWRLNSGRRRLELGTLSLIHISEPTRHQ